MKRLMLPGNIALDLPDEMTPDQMTAVATSFLAERDAQKVNGISYEEAQKRQLGKSWFPSLESGLAQAGLGMLSLGSRVTGIGDPNALNREADILERAASAVSQDDTVPDILQRGVRGVAASVPGTLVGGLAGGPYGAIAAGMASESNRALTEGEQRGLKGADLHRYAAVKGGVEGAIAAGFQLAGMGGAEKVFRAGAGKEAARLGLRQWVKQFAKDAGHELREEEATELSHLLVDKAMIGDEDAEITGDMLKRTLADTAVQTMMQFGLFKGGEAAVAALDTQQPKKRLGKTRIPEAPNGPVADPGDETPVTATEPTPEPQVADTPPQPSQEYPPPPSAEEVVSNIPTEGQPNVPEQREGVILDGLRQKEGRLQGSAPSEVVDEIVTPPDAGGVMPPMSGQVDLRALKPKEVESVWRELTGSTKRAPSKSEMIADIEAAQGVAPPPLAETAVPDTPLPPVDDVPPPPEPLYESAGEEGIVARVYPNDRGFAVVVEDIESGEQLPSVRVYKTLEEAQASADSVAQLRPEPGLSKPAAEPPAAVVTPPSVTPQQESPPAVTEAVSQPPESTPASRWLSETVPVDESDSRFKDARREPTGPGGYIHVVDQQHLAEAIGEPRPVFHETNLDNVRKVIQRIKAGNRRHSLFVSDDPSLAIGQGGKGYVIELDSTQVNGRRHQKPASGYLESVGIGGEFVVEKSLPTALVAVTVKNTKALDSLRNTPGFDKILSFDSATPTERGIRIPSRSSVTPRPETPQNAPESTIGDTVAVLMPLHHRSLQLEGDTPPAPKKRAGTKAEQAMMLGTQHQQRRVNLSTPVAGKSIRAADIMATWKRLFNVPIRSGGIENKKAEGIYRHLEEVVRLPERNVADFVVGAHEIAHHVDKTHRATTDKLAALQATDPTRHAQVVLELEGLDYDPQKRRVSEGFAELFRHLLTGDRTVAPAAMRWLEEEIIAPSEQLSKAVTEAKAHSDRYADQGFLQRVQSVFGGEPRDLDWREVTKEQLMKLPDRIYQQTVDRRYMIYKLSEELEKRGAISPDEATPYEMVMAFEGTAGAHAAQWLHEGVTTVGPQRQKLGDGIVEALDSLKDEADYQAAQAYAIAKHRLAVPPGYSMGGLTVDDAQAVIAEVQKDPDKLTRYENFAQRLTKFNDDLIRMLVDAGRLTQEEGQRITQSYSGTYVPLMREGHGPAWRTIGTRAVNMGPAVFSRSKTGSGRPIVDLIDATTIRAQRFAKQAMTQQVLEKIVRAADPALGGAEGMGQFISRYVPNSKVHRGRVKEILKTLVDEGFVEADDAKASVMKAKDESGIPLSPRDIKYLENRYGFQYGTQDFTDALKKEPSANAVVELWRTDYRLPNGKYVIRVNVDGKSLMYELDPDFYEALAGLDIQVAGPFFDILRHVAAPFKAGAVAMNTAFGIQNLFRDATTAAINFKHVEGANRATKSLAWAKRYTAAMLYGQPSDIVSLFREYGGELYSAIGADRDSMRRMRQRMMKTGTIERIRTAGSVKSGAKEMADLAVRWADHVREVVAFTDVGPRLAEMEGRLRSLGYEERNGVMYNTATNQPEMPPRDIVIKAINAAGDVTYNYRRAGHITRGYVEPFLPFTNAAVQATDKSARTLARIARNVTDSGVTGKQARQAAIALSVIAAASVAIGMLRRDDDDYKEQDWWLRFQNWTAGDGGKTQLKIGQSREYAFIPNAILAVIAEAEGERGVMKAAAREEIAQRIPAGGGLVKALWEVATNWSSFGDRPLEPEYLLDEPTQYRATDYTLKSSKLLGRAANKLPVLNRLSPIEIEHLLNGATGGAYQRWIGTGEALLSTAGVTEGRKLGVRNIPVVRGVVVDRLQNRSVDEFYEAKSQAKMRSREAEIEKRESTDRAEYERLVNTETMMAQLRKLKTDTYDPTPHIVGLAREALGKEQLASYPHPLYDEKLPEPAKKALQESIVADARRVAERLGYPRQKADEPDDKYASRVADWNRQHAASQAWIRQHKDSPLMRDAIKSVIASKAFQRALVPTVTSQTTQQRLFEMRDDRQAAIQFRDEFSPSE